MLKISYRQLSLIFKKTTWSCKRFLVYVFYLHSRLLKEQVVLKLIIKRIPYIRCFLKKNLQVKNKYSTSYYSTSYS